MGELVAHDAHDLIAQLIGVSAEVCYEELPAGTSVDVDVEGTPAWAAGGSTDSRTPPTDNASFGGFLNYLVNAFGARVELKKLLTPGQTILLVHGITEEEKECRVVDVRPNRTGKWKVGLAFVKPEGNFWHVFQPLTLVGAER